MAGMEPSEINKADVVVEVRGSFDAYEAALVRGDADEITAFFWDDDRALRFGIEDIQHSRAEIALWRAEAPPVPADRVVSHVEVTAFGDDVATVNCEFRYPDDQSIGRQSQTWVRFPEGWRITSAHVSVIGAIDGHR